MARAKLASSPSMEVDSTARLLYGDLVTTWLYYSYGDSFRSAAGGGENQQPLKFYKDFAAELEHYIELPQLRGSPLSDNAAHVFACCFQVHRAYQLIGEQLRGNSGPIARLRASVWQSIFTHDLRLWGSLLYDRMHDIATLIIGPTGTGKELVARSIGLSRYIPFDPKRQQFTEHSAGAFHPVNLSAMPRELIESEMFGHCAGAFTGAVKDREGWFEKCRECHSVFLDEIGELAEDVQVKLLRVLQSREFQRVGETTTRHFSGKVIAATNRDLATEAESGKFRPDLYFRLGSDVIRTPSLREQLDDRPDDLPTLVQLVAAPAWVIGPNADMSRGSVTKRSIGFEGRSNPINLILGQETSESWNSVSVASWSEVSIVLLRRTEVLKALVERPASLGEPALDQLCADICSGMITYDDLLDHYCSLVFARAGNVTRVARRLGKHCATIQSRIKKDLVERYTRHAPPSD